MAKRRIPPEQRARWERARQELAAAVAEIDERIRERRERDERRRARLQHLSFGLLGRRAA